MAGIILSYHSFLDFFASNSADPIKTLPDLLASKGFKAAFNYARCIFAMTSLILFALASNYYKVTKLYETHQRKKSQSEVRRLKGQVAFKKLKKTKKR